MAASDCGDVGVRVNMSIKTKNGGKVAKSALVIAEDIKLAKVLAGNNKQLRERALKRLKKWFRLRSQSMPFTEDDFMRIWKGLFYSLWMSDKPLVQEECAEAIARLVHFHALDASLLFFKCGLRTLGDEWFGLDQLRLGKFLMFVRRLLRQALLVLKNNSWDIKAVKAYNDVLGSTVLSVDAPPPCGLTMHFAEIYLEELAKVSEGELKHHVLTEMLRPFVKQSALLKDSRQITCIKRHIFRHLLKQSDAGMDYEEKFKAWRREGFRGGSIDVMRKQDEAVSDDEEDGRGEVREEKEDEPLDPRAGRVDVVLPQLKFSAKQIAQMLAQNKFVEGSTTKSRRAIAALFEEFTELSKGRYPLGIKKVDRPRNDRYSTKTKKAVNRLVKFERKLMGMANRRKRQNGDDSDTPGVKRKRKHVDGDFEDRLKKFIEESEGEPLGTDEERTYRDTETGAERAVKKSKAKVKENLVKVGDKREDVATRLKERRNRQKDVVNKKNFRDSNDGKLKASRKRKLPASRGLAGAKHNLPSVDGGEDIVGGGYECSFKRNSGVWLVFNGDDSASDASSQNLSTVFEGALSSSLDETAVSWLSTEGRAEFAQINCFTAAEARSVLVRSPKAMTKREPASNSSEDLEETPPEQQQQVKKLSTRQVPPLNMKQAPSSSPVYDGSDCVSTDKAFAQNEWDVPLREGEVEVFVPSVGHGKSVRVKSRTSSGGDVLVKNPFSTRKYEPSSSKKVKIDLKLNRSQEIHEHVAQVKSSPDIPFDANKKPIKPLLKRHSDIAGPVNPFYKRKLKL